jgi:phosphate uptake regulator
MKRKIMKLGPATLVISLPSKWARKQEIKPGDEIDLEEQENSLILRLKEDVKNTKEIIDIRNINKLYKRIFASRYLKGVDEIEIHFDTQEKSRAIQKRVDDMIGMEVIEQGKDKIIVKDLSGQNQDNFDNILKRILFLLNSLSDESLKAIQKRETDLEYLEDLEKNMNRFTDYCFRILNKKGHTDYRETAVLYCILFLLEDIGDEYKKFLAYINIHKLELSNESIKIFEHINNLTKNLQKLFLKFSYEDAIAFAEARDKIISMISKKKIDKKEFIVLNHFETITENMIKIMGQLLNIN